MVKTSYIHQLLSCYVSARESITPPCGCICMYECTYVHYCICACKYCVIVWYVCVCACPWLLGTYVSELVHLCVLCVYLIWLQMGTPESGIIPDMTSPMTPAEPSQALDQAERKELWLFHSDKMPQVQHLMSPRLKRECSTEYKTISM